MKWPSVVPLNVAPILLFYNHMPSTSDLTPELLTRDEVARLLKISRATLYRLVEARRLPFYKVGHSLRFDKRDVMAFLRNHRVDALGATTYGSQKA